MLLQELYAAPGTETGWLQFLERLRDAVRGSACSLATKQVQSEQCGIVLSSTADPEAQRRYNEQFGALDPWAHSPRARLLFERSVVAGDELIAHREMQGTSYHADYASRYDM